MTNVKSINNLADVALYFPIIRWRGSGLQGWVPSPPLPPPYSLLTCGDGIGQGPQSLTHHAPSVPGRLVIDALGEVLQSFLGHLLFSPGVQ